MTTSKQAQANKRNAQKSTGPKTLEGKEAASKNARKHNLFTQESILDGEDPELYDLMMEKWCEYLDPMGPMEHTLAQTIMGISWRLHRVLPAENALWARAAEDDTVNLAHELDKLSRHEARLLRSLKQAMADLRQTQADDEKEAFRQQMAEFEAKREAMWEELIRHGPGAVPYDASSPVVQRSLARMADIDARIAAEDAAAEKAAEAELALLRQNAVSQSVSAPMASFCRPPLMPQYLPGQPGSDAVKHGKVPNGGRVKNSLLFT